MSMMGKGRVVDVILDAFVSSYPPLGDSTKSASPKDSVENWSGGLNFAKCGSANYA